MYRGMGKGKENHQENWYGQQKNGSMEGWMHGNGENGEGLEDWKIENGKLQAVSKKSAGFFNKL